MALTHNKWTRTGRLLSDGNRFAWGSSSGQRNVDIGGDFAPYVWDKATNIARFGDGELRLTATGLEYW